MSNKGGRNNRVRERFCFACQQHLPANLETFTKNMLKADKDGNDGWRRCEK